MLDHNIEDLVLAWFKGDQEGVMYDACTDEPETAWKAILEILKHELTEEQKALLAGGPLETLLVWHGTDFIHQVEQEARVNEHFNYLLGGVWRQKMPQDIWLRIEKVRKKVW